MSALLPLGLAMLAIVGVIAYARNRPLPPPRIDPIPGERLPDEYRIVAFGTSLTARGGWQEPLAAALERCFDRPVRVLTVARSGATSNWALGALRSVRDRTPDVVLVEFAGNDARLDRFIPVARSGRNFGKLISDLRSPSGTRVIAMAMNPAAGLRGLLRSRLDAYSDAHLAVARQLGVETIDFRPAWKRLAPAERAQAIPDGIHPRPADAAAIIVPALLERLAPDGC